MIVAILADIHGNVEALKAVLDDLEGRPVDLCVLAGDLLANGPRPAETLQVLDKFAAPSVMGNMDQALFVDTTDEALAWTRDQIGSPGLAYLRCLPLSHRISPPNTSTPLSDLLIVHSTPRSCNDLLIVGLQPLGTSFTQLTPPEEALQMMVGAKANLMVYGHIHYTSQGLVGGVRVESIGSVGFPFDGDPRAAYAMAHWNAQQWSLEHIRVPYDFETVARDLEQCGMPYSKGFARRIREAKWFPRG